MDFDGVYNNALAQLPDKLLSGRLNLAEITIALYSYKNRNGEGRKDGSAGFSTVYIKCIIRNKVTVTIVARASRLVHAKIRQNHFIVSRLVRECITRGAKKKRRNAQINKCGCNGEKIVQFCNCVAIRSRRVRI